MGCFWSSELLLVIFFAVSWDSGSAWACPRCLQKAPPSKIYRPPSPPSSSRTTTGTSQTPHPHHHRSPSILSAPPPPHKSASLWAPRTNPSVTQSSDGCWGWAFCEGFRCMNDWLVKGTPPPLQWAATTPSGHKHADLTLQFFSSTFPQTRSSSALFRDKTWLWTTKTSPMLGLKEALPVQSGTWSCTGRNHLRPARLIHPLEKSDVLWHPWLWDNYGLIREA